MVYKNNDDPMATQNLPHLVIPDLPEPLAFTSTSRGGSRTPIPQRDRQTHSALLQKKLDEAWKAAQNEQVVSHATRSGVYLEFRGFPGVELVTKSLEDLRSKKVRLLNIREETVNTSNETSGEQNESKITYATVFVANDKLNHFSKKIEEYAQKDSPKGKPRNADLVNSIADLRKALNVESFWQDAKSLLPSKTPEWCEVWLSSDHQTVIDRFEQLLVQENIDSKQGFICFPERAVKLVHVTREQLERLTTLSDDIAEYRRAKETAHFFLNLQPSEQAEWVTDLLQRLKIDNDSQIAVCLLDTGVNNGHPLLAPLLTDNDCQCIEQSWGTHDHHNLGHGTLMAGVAAYGNLLECVLSSGALQVRHCLESVKILPPPPKQNEPELWGYVTSQAVSRAEIQAPLRKRIVCMAVSSADTHDNGRPSSWSAAVDQLVSGAEDDTQRLIVISAGNVSDPSKLGNYPDAQIEDSIHDPAQSWNALTVGAYTNLDLIRDPTLKGYQPIAPKGGISPFTTTSYGWDDRWPIKPEIMLEGGNMAQDTTGFATECDDLSVLSTYYLPRESHFYPFSMTSAATAQAAWFAAQIQATYPDFWPETIRALIVHSAEWPDVLYQQFGGNGSKGDIKKLLRICGYGIPDLQRALYSAANSLTLIAQAELQPFDKKEGSSGYRTKEMHLYKLPWPREVLLDLPHNTEVAMRITLSYFIEPGPGEIGWEDRYRYASHGLRFDLNSPGESIEDFKRRINTAAREDDEGPPGTQSPSEHWKIGVNNRNKGSIHSDIWQGTAAELASSNLVAISPRIGWWRERAQLERWHRQTRYALIISIMTPEESVDLYTPVATQIGLTVPISIEV